MLALDTETCLFGPGNMAPLLSCVSVFDGKTEKLIHHTEAESFLRKVLSSPIPIVGQHICYDFAVIIKNYPGLTQLVFDAYDANRIHDTKLRQQLIDISRGQFRGWTGPDGVYHKTTYDLAALARRHLGKTLEKDEWRMKYGELRDLPLSEWPEGAKQYPIEDAVSTWQIWRAQENPANEHEQVRAAFWLQLMSVRGMVTNGGDVATFTKSMQEAFDLVEVQLIDSGLVRKDGTRDTKAAMQRMVDVCRAEGVQPKRTAGGKPSLDSDACKATEDETLVQYAEYSTLKKVLSTDCEMLAKGNTAPIHSSFGLADTGRTTSSKPNLQNLRGIPGIRECFVPRPGFVFAQADYDGLELRTLAQVCFALFGQSKLKDALNAGRDPHLELAAVILGIPYEKAHKDKGEDYVKSARKLAKAANFGFPGGLGLDKFVLFAKKSGADITKQKAQELKEFWFKSWPEMRAYFDYVNSLPNFQNLRAVKQLFSGRVRGGASYTAACNSFFQGLGADATKRAGWLITKACYADKNSPLYGCYIVNYIHDEFILEVPEERGHEAAYELARLMVEGANEYLPDVPATTSPLLMRRWEKNATPVFEGGKLIC